MEYREFGATDIKASVLGLGCARIGSFHAKGSEKEALAMFLEALDSGINFFDTSDIYGQGDSERILGRAFKGSRDKVIFETKAGNCFSEAAKIASRFKSPLRMILKRVPFLMKKVRQVRSTQLSQNFESTYLISAAEASLRRLNTDYIDIFMLHSPPIEVIAEWAFQDAVEHLKKTGKIRYFGLSCDTGDQALLCLEHSGVDAIQVPVNSRERTIIERVLPLADSRKVAVVGRSPFATGTLFAGEDHGEHRARSVKDLTPAQAALLAATVQKGVSVVIAGTSNRAHLRENLLPFSASTHSWNDL